MTSPSRVTYFFDCGGVPRFVKDKNGNELTFAVDDPDNCKPTKRVTDVTDAGGRSIHLDYYGGGGGEENKRVSRITDHSGRALEFCYDSEGGDHPNLLRIIDHPIGDLSTCKAPASTSRSFVFTYEGEGSQQHRQMLTVRDPRLSLTTFAYYPPGDPREDKLQTRIDRASASTGFNYTTQPSPGTNTTTVTAPPTSAQRVTVYTDVHDPERPQADQDEGLIDSVLDPAQRTTSIAWTNRDQVPAQPLRKVRQVTEPGTRVTRFSYNARGLVTDTYDPMDHHRHFDYLEVAADGGFTTDLTGFTDENGNQWTFTYDASNRNVVKVIDPDHSPTDPFLTIDYYEGSPGYPGAVERVTDGNGNPTTYDGYDLNGLPTAVRDAKDQVTLSCFDHDGLLLWVQDPRHAGESGLPCPQMRESDRDFRTVSTRDGFHRPTAVTSPKTTKYDRGKLIRSDVEYDENDNATKFHQPEYGGQGEETRTVYDKMDRPIRVHNPEGETTANTFDAAGRLVQVTRPKGLPPDPPAEPGNDYATDLEYDLLDRVVSQIVYDADGIANRKTHYCYNQVGDLRWVTAPKANEPSPPPSAACENEQDPGAPPYTTRYHYNNAHRLTSVIEPLDPAGPNPTRTRQFGYDEAGNLTSTTDELLAETKYFYSKRNELVRKEEPFTSSPARTLTSVYSYDRTGNLTCVAPPRAWDAGSRCDPFAPPGSEQFVTEYRYDAVNQLERIALPDDAGPEPRTYIHRRYDPNGNLKWTTLPVPNTDLNDPPSPQIAQEKWTELRYFDPGWIASSNDHVNAQVDFDYWPEGWQERRNACAATDLCTLRTWRYFPDGMLERRTFHRDGKQGGDGFADYTYDKNNNLKTATEAVGLETPDQLPYSIVAESNGYDELIQTRQWQGTENPKYTDYAHDLNGNVEKRWDSGASQQTGRRHDFVYDQANQLTEDVDQGPNPTQADDDQRTKYLYFLNGLEQQKLVQQNPGWTRKVQTDSLYFRNGDLQQRSTKNEAGTEVELHTLTYLQCADGTENCSDAQKLYLNGNRTKDVFKLKGPNGAPTSCESSCGLRFTYGPRENLKSEVADWRSDHTWTYTDALDIFEERVDGVLQSRNFYEGNRLTRTENGQGQVMSRYFYDQDGNLQCMTTSAGAPSDCNDPFGVPAPVNLVERYRWDYLGRLKSFRRTSDGNEEDRASYVHDPLDRLVRQVEAHNGPERTTCFTYVGLSGALGQEQRVPSICGQGATQTKSYALGPDLERTSMNVTGAGAENGDFFFARNVHGDPSMLLRGSTGTTKTTYGYLPYGQGDPTLAKGEHADATDPFNAYRFNDRRLDTGSGSSEMGARRYSTGLGRFLQFDFYSGAEADLGLSLDPLNMNRYVFAAGNPIGFLDIDGNEAYRPSDRNWMPDRGQRRYQRTRPTSSPGSGGEYEVPNPERTRWRRHHRHDLFYDRFDEEYAGLPRGCISEEWRREHGSACVQPRSVCASEEECTGPPDWDAVFLFTLPFGGTEALLGRLASRPVAAGVGRVAQWAGRGKAAKAGDDVAAVGTDLAVRPKLNPGYHYLHVRKMQRSIRTADVLDAYKHPLKVGEVRWHPIEGPSILFQGRNAQVAVNPWTGKIVSAYPTGSKLRRKLLRDAGLGE